MRAVRIVLLLAPLLAAHVALAYEGAGRVGADEEAPPPPPPKLTKAPGKKKEVKAVYPAALLTQTPPPGGVVMLVIQIAADGTVPSATVQTSSGFPEMDAAALDAIKQFEFTPAELDNKPAAIRLQYEFRFTPPPPPPPPPPDAPPKLADVNYKGRILERGTRDPLRNATVYLPQSGLNAETDKDGRFEIRGAPLGPTKVEVNEPKHRKLYTTEEIKPGKVTEVTYYLWDMVEGEFETTVHGDREKKDVSEHVLTHDELVSVPGSNGDPVRVIEDMPGMARVPYGFGALLVRGSNPGDTQALVDGVPIPLLFHFAGGPSVINPNFVSAIDFFPGAYGAKYGRAIAGIVDVETRPADPKAIHGDINLDLIQSNIYLEGPISKDQNLGSWELGARRSYLNVWLPIALQYVQTPGQALIVAAPVYWDYQGRYDLKLGRNEFEISVFGSDDQLAVAQAGTAQTAGFSVYTHQAFHKLRLKWSTKTPDGWSFWVSPSAGPNLNSFNYSTEITGAITDWNPNLRAGAKKQLLKSLSLEMGIEFNADIFNVKYLAPAYANYEQFPNESPVTTYSSRSFNANAYEEAAYIEAVWNPFGGLKIIPGVRAELYNLPHANTVSPEPRAAIRYEFHTGTTLKAGWGLYAEPPPPQYMDSQYGNPYLGLQKSMQTVVGIEQKITSTLSADVQGYYNIRSNLVVPSQQANLLFDNTGHGYSYGLEVLLRQEVTKRMFGWIAYTLARSVQWDPVLNEYTPSAFDETHILTIVASYKFDYGIEAGLRFQLATGRPTTAVLGSTFDADNQGYNAANGQPGLARLPLFDQLDIRIEKFWTLPLFKISVFLDIQNVYNAPNQELILYNYDYTQSNEVRGLPILPTIGVAGHF